MERRLAAILAADVADYSRLTGTDEAGTPAIGLAAINACLPEFCGPMTERHGGRVMRTVWDSLLLEFTS